MRSVYALLIGISEYTPPVSRLFGCTNDLKLLNGWLSETFTEQTGFQYKPTLLTDIMATRKAVIDGFEIFDDAAKDDICIFYYSGHGSLVKTDTAFWTDGSDYLNSLVCYDSRTTGGYDLVDKEIAYLIWKATNNKPDLHFVSIMDCCFAGSNTRDVTEINRMFESNETVKNATELLGYGSYVNGVPPRGRYVALSASQSNQTSKEKIINGVYHGVFSYFLVQSLRQKLADGGYLSLMDRVKLLTISNTRAQVPMIEAYQTDIATQVFGVPVMPKPEAWLLFYREGWKINKGSVHGVQTGQKVLLDSGETAEVISTDTSESRMMISNEPARNLIHPVYSKSTIPVTLQFFVDDPSNTIRASLETEMAAHHYEGIRFTADPHIADYFICYDKNQKLAMTDPGSSLLYRFTNVYHGNPEIFLSRLQHVARWASVVNLCNPDGQDFAEQMEASVFDWENTQVARLVNPAEHVFKYTMVNGSLAQPRAGLTIKNNGTRAVYTSLFYCGCDFSVSDQLLANVLIDAGKQVDASYTNRAGKQSQSIPINIPAAYREAGYRQVTDFIVLLFSDTPISSADLCLAALPLANKNLKSAGTQRGIGSLQPKIQKPVWGTIKIPMLIEL